MFLSTLLLEADPEPLFWVVRGPLHWSCERFGTRSVPPGFRTNLASTPGLVQAIGGFHCNGLTRRPAVLHDHEYTLKTLTKEDADLLFFHAMLAERVPHQVALACYEAVRLFGHRSWTG